MMRPFLLGIGAFAMVGCMGTDQSLWSLNSVVNSERGVVVVWRQAQYEGGAFNGFDNDARSIAKASYEAFLLASAEGGLQSSRVPTDFTYTASAGGTPDPVFALVDGQLHVGRCGAGGAQPDAGSGCRQDSGDLLRLGRRGEAVEMDGTQLVLRPRPGADACTIDLPRFTVAEGEATGITAARLAITYFPERGVLYLVDGVDPQGSVYVSVDCGGFEPIAFDAGAAAWRQAFPQGANDGRIIDIAPGESPYKPVLLLDWTRKVDGVFIEEAGVFPLESGARSTLPGAMSRPVGFMGADGSRVLVSADGDLLDGKTSKVSLTIYEWQTGQSRTFETTIPLG